MKKPKTLPQELSPPLIIQLPSTSEAKMEAIVSLSKAVHEMARALNGCNTKFTLKNISVNNSQGTGIHIEGTMQSEIPTIEHHAI